MRIPATLVVLLLAVGASAQPTLPLYTWYSPSRGDYFTTSDPAWAGRAGDRKSPDYAFVRVEGQVFNPAFTQPDAVPLYSWWNAARGDNFLTSDPVWRGRPGDAKDGYTLTRIEGYVYRKPLAGMVALRTFWHRGAQDNYATTDPRYTAAGPSGYAGPGVAGYVFPPPLDAVSLADFGFGTLKVNGTAATGRRPLLVMLVEFSDATFREGRDRDYYHRLIFGPGYPNIADYYLENSSRTFTWAPAGTIGPIREPRTYAEGMLDGYASDGSPISEGRRAAGRALMTVAGQQDLSVYDANRDGTLTTDELTLLMIHAGPDDNDGASNRWTSPQRVQAGPRLAVQADVAIAGDGASFTTIGHELFHSLGAPWDLYGSGFHSSGLTLMSVTGGGGRERRESYHLDPWYKMRLGWIAPRVVALNENGDVAEVAAAQVTGTDPATRFNRRPVLLYDPVRGPREFFLVEFRNAAAAGGGYDRSLSDWRGNPSGIGVWNAKVDASHNPLGIPGIKITPGRNGRIDSALAGNDVFVDGNGDGINDRIDPGDDRALQSVPADDDRYWDDQAVFMRGAPNGRRGDAALLRAADGDMVVDWIRTGAEPSVRAFRIRAGNASADGSKSWVEWSLGDPLIPRIDLSVGPGTPGSPVTLRGLFGVAQGPRIVSLHDDDRGRYDLTVVSWTPTEIVARIPSGIPPGQYDLVIYTDATRTRQSNWRPFEARP